MLVAQGARLVLTDVSTQVEAVAAELVAAGGEAVAHVGDITNEAVVEGLMRLTRETYGRLDILDNCAGATNVSDRDISVTSMDTSLWDEVMAINVRGPMLTCKHGIPLMREHGGGSIINISSGMSLLGDDAHVAYAAGKAALNALTRSVATAYGKDGIRCNAILPGVVRHGNRATERPTATTKIMIANTLVGRLGTPEDIGAMVVFLASDAAGYLTGQLIPIDGGHSAHQPHVVQFRDLAGQS
jgi:NAD(P)-dependent dehydrogenase (short-subunit alcohol dehydrogenase family)